MYSKIQVNTPSAIPVVKSDTYNIPNPGRLVFQGTDSSASTGVIVDTSACANSFTSQTTSAGGGNLLVDSRTGLDFQKNSYVLAGDSQTGVAQQVFAIQVGNQVEETSGNTTGHVVTVDSATTLTLDNTVGAGNNVPYILRQNGFINRLDVNVGYLVYNLTDLTQNFVTAVTNDAQLSVGGSIMAANDVYQIYSQNAADLSLNDANSAALIYVGGGGTISTFGQQFVNIKVTTANNQDITFENFPVGQYLPAQCVKVWATGTDADVKPITIF